MKDVIEGILQGNFDYENGSLDFSCAKLELTLYKDETEEGSFHIYGRPGCLTRGKVYSSDLRMRCLTTSFIGEDEEIVYRFDAHGMEAGEVIKGEFYVISNQGEYYLPFVVNIAHKVLESSLGNIKNLFHFTNLAKTNWDEAVSLFYNPMFKDILNGNDRQYYYAYQGLSKIVGNQQNMEEFLLVINKKQKADYIIQDLPIRIEDPEDETQCEIKITRNGWGYTHLEVAVRADFLVTEKETITEDDFLGNYCRLPLVIDKDRLHAGNNYGLVLIITPYEKIEVPILVTVKNHAISGRSKRRELGHTMLQLMEFYQAFRMKKISTGTWLKETGKLVERLVAADDKNISARLFQAQLLISQERFNEAQWILEHALRLLQADMASTSVEWCYYLYLTTLLNREEAYIDEIAAEVEQTYKEGNGDWRIAWLLLYLSEDYNKSATKKWLFLEEQSRRGCTSPIIYIEALLLLNANPSLLMKLDTFELQVLGYAAKKEALSKEIIEQILSLAPKVREYSGILFTILEACYQIRTDRETLTAVCSLLMKGGKVGKEYFKWYKRGVEQELRLTRLYDYYMLSIDLNYEGVIHKMVLMYYSYNSDLDYERNAFLYANVHRYQEQFRELYLNYEPQIEKFVVEQIQKRHINRDLAYLYKYFFQGSMINEETALAMSSLLFVNLIQTDRMDIRQVIIYQAKTQVEQSYPVVDGLAKVPVYGNEYTILFEDSRQYRYISSVPYTLEKLMIPGKIAKSIAPLIKEHQGLNIYLCESGKGNIHIDEDTKERFFSLMNSPEIEDDYRREITLTLLQYYYDHDELNELDNYLLTIEPTFLHVKERAEFIRFMVLRGMNEKAYEWIKTYGPHSIEAKTVVRLCSQIISQNGYMEDETMTGIIVYGFRNGKYDEVILKYLIKYFNGMTKELRNIWKAALSFDVDAYELCEKMILQMLFTGSFIGEKIDVFRYYVQGGAKTEVEAAFLSQCAYDSFVKDKLMDGYVFEEILRFYRGGENLHLVCKLALLKHYAENKNEITSESQKMLTEFMDEMMENKIHLSFFKEYEEYCPKVGQLSDKVIVEYHKNPRSKAVLHYVLEGQEGENGEYRMEEMRDIFGGICVKEFVLFFGESLQYYVMEELDGHEQLTESDTIQKSDMGQNYDKGKYNLVNDIVIAGTLQDYDTIDELMDEYQRTQYLTDHLFEIK